MPRPKGTKVVVCACGARIVGFPGKVMKCNHCGKKYTIPKGTAAKKPTAVKKAATKKASAKKAVTKKAT